MGPDRHSLDHMISDAGGFDVQITDDSVDLGRSIFS
jgi:hypothetical protein